MAYHRTWGLGDAYSPIVQQASQTYGVPADLIQAVIQQESSGNPNAVSPAGAQGLMQLMPATARNLGVTNPFDPTENINGGAQLLSQLLTRYNGNTALALAAYNAGPTAVDNAGGIPNYPETQNYVQKILANLLGTPPGSFHLVLPTSPHPEEPQTAEKPGASTSPPSHPTSPEQA
jgi:soluble lytic murein transglycosylase-like protein